MSLADKIGGAKPANDAPKLPKKTNGHGGNGSSGLLERARKYVAKMEPAISGSGGHTATLDVVMVCKGFGLTESQTLTVLHEYNERCQPPWNERELEHKAKQLPRLRVAEGYILDQSRPWEQQREATRRAMPAPEDPGGPPLWGEGGPAEERAKPASESVAASIDGAIELVRRRHSRQDEPVPVPFYDYTKALGLGLWPGVEVLISTTGGLKTQLAVQKLLHAAKQGVPSLFITLELTKTEATLRLLAELAGVSWSKAMTAQLSNDEIERFEQAKGELSQFPLTIRHGEPYTYSSESLAQDVAHFRAHNPTGRGYVVVDFAQLMKCG